MLFKSEDDRTFFHLLDTDTQIMFFELEALLYTYGKRLEVGAGTISEENDLELVLRILD